MVVYLRVMAGRDDDPHYRLLSWSRLGCFEERLGMGMSGHEQARARPTDLYEAMVLVISRKLALR